MKLSPQFHSQWPTAILSLALDTVFVTAAEEDERKENLEGEGEREGGRAAAATALMRDVSEFTLARPGAGETFLVHVLQQMWVGLTDVARDR